tara:strand:- start:134 stop:529 length:396 start_codon:yes stop_codon:yes gene_type:complete
LFFQKAGFEILFLNAAGQRQLDKKPMSAKERKVFEDKKFYTYKLSKNGRIKINLGYQEFLKTYRKLKYRRMLRTRILQKFISIILGKKNYMKLSSINKKIKSKTIYDVISQSEFSYDPDREFLRIIGKKVS